ncbi:aldehyde-activating protein [Xanthomonas citri pv. fuscans CFBP 6996]|uniref:GFA family protein n=1 Tax=Xanthomonas citri TaxID=346 RepID=UPI000C1975A2|nr:aldehyde-activating protein [Xanthomonas citri]ATS52377.1 aldehyde-activating protein [Xanthomonas citri pv. phaseoli var. fuscans]ATS54259.1 aldehyde-activating protein [Xanthomonas citri pv. phaseoli var. fuscans]ATS58002.1 aldehyde-activating protein [Xanthomonas citri pv. phaseoli var. fuscans]PTY29398.1 aldehyde-activating protein [Xanthomonas citri pv. fuscans CFBP 6996]QWN16972.1 aldehyde-activating protein [Xanthomonas citri]
MLATRTVACAKEDHMHYAGSRHCGPIAFDLQTEAPIAEVYDCSCSLCRRRGGLFWFGARTQRLLQAAPEAVGSYRFHQHHIDRHDCRQCGIAPGRESLNPKTGAMGVAVNVHCLPALDLAGLQVHAVDGASR